MLFENVGGKLKTLAIVATVIGMMGSVIAGFIFFTISPITGILIILGGCLCSWLGSLAMYGLGQAVENTDKILAIQRKLAQTPPSASPTAEHSPMTNAPQAASPVVTKNLFRVEAKPCPHCGEMVKSSSCSMCGQKNNLF